jgi:OOP family OmpA-OmpF porin
MFSKKNVLSALFLGLMVSSMAVQATDDEEGDDFYIAPFGSYLHQGGDTEAFDGFGAGLAIGKEINEQFNIEVRGFWQNYGNDYSCCKNKPNVSLEGDSTLAGGTVDLQWFILRDTFSPYVVAAAGGMNTDYQMNSVVLGKAASYEANTTSFIFESGVGATYQVTNNFALRSDVRYRLNSMETTGDNVVLHDLTVNFGAVIGLGIGA